MQSLLPVIAFMATTAMAATNYVAPSPIEVLDQKSQAYQLGVWSFFIIVLVGIAAAYTVGSIDYSDDTLLMVEVDNSAAGAQE